MSNATAPSILGLLTWGPMTGYQLKCAIEDSIGNFWSESFGQIYPELRRLEEAGFVKSESEDEKSPRAKKRYQITDGGRAELSRWLSQPPRQRPPRNELLLKIFFARHGDLNDILDHVEDALSAYKRKLAYLQERERSLKAGSEDYPSLPFWLITIRNGISSYAANIAWCEQTIAELQRLNQQSAIDQS